MISDQSIEKVLERADIVDVVSRYVQLKRQGNNYVACCPFHKESKPSFAVNPIRNSWHCFGACNEGGNAISFMMRYNNMSFPEAVKELANIYNVQLEETDKKHNALQREESLKRDSMFLAYQSLQPFFVSQLGENTEECKRAMAYASNRWSRDFIAEYGIGYAPRNNSFLIDYARIHNIPQSVLMELGVLRKSDKEDGSMYSFYRERIMIPIRDRFSRIIGYTARYIGENPDAAKYLNSASSIIYSKDSSVFGINVALRAAVREDKLYLVEGAPDVLRLHLIGANNTAASLGSAWTEKQFNQLKRFTSNLCFLPDADPPKPGELYGTGIASVIKNAQLAMRLGFNVSVKEIPMTSQGQKNDPDSHCRDRETLNALKEEDFIVWYAKKLFAPNATQEERSKAVIAIADLIVLVKNDVKESMYLDSVAKINGTKSLWKTAISNAKHRLSQKALQPTDRKNVDLDMLNKYGFQEKDHCYISITNDGRIYKWSNFTMEPLFHIKDPSMSMRLYKMTNDNGRTETVELKQEELVSLTKFRLRVEGLGNYLWFAKEGELNKLKSYLYANTESATRIDQLGWQRQGFFAFGNGVFDTEWHPVDELGIVRLGERGIYYLPAFSSIYREEIQFYQFERAFSHFGHSTISLREFCERFIKVFGDNGKVCIAFLLATLFRDIVFSYTTHFPILNIFGPKGSGKSKLGAMLMSFFIANNTAPNIVNSTIAALAEAVAQSSNALVHLDEFKNNIEMERREFLKGLWDGTGRNRMSMERDKKREVTKVNSGVIVSGQEMATADIALFSRFIFLSYNKVEFSIEAQRQFEELKVICSHGCTHLTMEILRFRSRFEADFKHNYNIAFNDIVQGIQGTQEKSAEDRIMRNWTIPLAAFRTLGDVLNLPLQYNDLLDISIKGVRRQNDATKKNNELSSFWNIVSFLHQDGKIWFGGDYRIENEERIKCSNHKDEIIFQTPKRVLYLRYNRVFELYKTHGRMVNEALLPPSSLTYYLEHSSAYIGKKRSVRFKRIINGNQMTQEVENKYGPNTYAKSCAVDQAMCFDYDQLNEIYDINLEDLSE